MLRDIEDIFFILDLYYDGRDLLDDVIGYQL
jgi:hypothetical protein